MPTASSKSTPELESSRRNRPARRTPRLFGAELFLVRAESRSGLITKLKGLWEYLGRPEPAPLHDLAFTVSREYEPGECVAIVASSHADLRAKLEMACERLSDDRCEKIQNRDGVYYSSERLGRGKLAFVFPGENAQYPNMLAELCLNFPEIREVFDTADAACAMAGDGFLPSALNFPAPQANGAGGAGGEMFEWEKAVVLVHTANTALSRLLEALEIRPDAVLGHSFGELSALEAAGVLRPGEGADRVRFAHHAYLHLRELSRERDLPVGHLLAVGGAGQAEIDRIVSRFPDALRIAMENCPHQYVLCASGPGMDGAIDEAERWLSSEGAICSRLPIRRPYHTDFFEPAFPFEKAYYDGVGVHPPQIEVYSCATTEPFPEEPAPIAEVAARHWMSCVRFQATIEKMYERGFRVFIDVGPRGNLCAFVDDILNGRPHLAVALNRAQRPEVHQLLSAVGILAAHGVRLRVDPLHERWGSRAVELQPGSGSTGRKPLSIQLPIHLPVLKAGGIVVRRPEPAPATPPPDDGPFLQAPPSAVRDEVTEVMLAHMQTMERFLKTQSELLGALFETAPPEAEAAPPDTGRFSMLGSIQEIVPAESLVARRVLNVEEDLYLNDHALGTTVSATDPSLKALPVMPITFSLELAAEASAALFPELKVMAIVDIRAHRWVLVEEGTVTLRVIATRAEGQGSDTRVHVAIQQETAADPRLFPTVVEVLVILGDALPPAPRSMVAPLPGSAACDWSGGDIYPRRTFHGPLFQGIRSVRRLSDEGLDGTLTVLPHSGLLRSRPDAELEIDPLLVDLLGQTVWIWDSREPFLGRACLPYSGGALKLYRPPLRPGTTLDFTLRVRQQDEHVVVTDLEAVDPEGNVRLTMESLGDRRFEITPSLHRLMLEPLNHHFADVRALDLPRMGAPAMRVSVSAIASFPRRVLESSFGVWRKALAFLILSPPEREEWRALGASVGDEIDWLLERAAAKDALRHHLLERAGLRLGSADLVVREGAWGTLELAGAWRSPLPTAAEVSIDRSEDMVLAVASPATEDVRLGIATARVGEAGDDVRRALSRDELSLLPTSAGGADAAEWVFRFLCAREAFGKASGPLSSGRSFRITGCDETAGLVTVRPETAGETAVATFRVDRHVCAVAAASATGAVVARRLGGLA